MEHPTWVITVIMAMICGMIIGNIFRARGGVKLFIRRITAIDAIEEAVGRATEMGRPISFETGLDKVNIRTLQALSVLGHVARLAARLGARLIVPVCQPQVLPIAEEMVRDAYSAEGRSEAFNPNDIRFISDSQFAYAAGVVGTMMRENVAANIMLGRFQAEALIIAETGQGLRALQVAGVDEPTQIPFFITACDYVIIGEEYYATSAYITREPTLLGSLVGQDWSKLLLFALILVGVIVVSLPSFNFMGITLTGPKGSWLVKQLTGG